MSEPALKYENNASFEQIYTQKLLIAFKMACYCCFSFGGKLDFPEFVQKKIYNINTLILATVVRLYNGDPCLLLAGLRVQEH